MLIVNMLLRNCCIICVSFIIFCKGRQVNFPGTISVRTKGCRITELEQDGNCVEAINCPGYSSLIRKVPFSSIHCRNAPTFQICCPDQKKVQNLQTKGCRIEELDQDGNCIEPVKCPGYLSLIRKVSFASIHCKNAATLQICCPDQTEVQNLQTKGCRIEELEQDGNCVEPVKCPEYSSLIRKVSFASIHCKKAPTFQICCPGLTAKPSASLPNTKAIDVSPPIGNQLLDCGRDWKIREGMDLSDFYAGNVTADRYRRQGFQILKEVVDRDELTSFTVSNGTFSKVEQFFRKKVIGGIIARRSVTLYMAIIGTKGFGRDIDWKCGGVLINSEWVLTAAHCFKDDLNIVRLGEYNLKNRKSKIEDPQDYEIKRSVRHPEFSFPANYHDLALIQLSKRTFLNRPDIIPVCLPWGDESNLNIIGTKVTLTGWGMISFSGPTSDIALEVNVTVFDSSRCRNSYSTVHSYESDFPDGINNNLILCVGDIEGEKDACGGDSGGPIVYRSKKTGRFTLAGIVSSGNGCGAKKYPGIYTPIHRKKHLTWIKEIAFSK